MYICFIIQKVPLQYFSDDEKFKAKKNEMKRKEIFKKKKNITKLSHEKQKRTMKLKTAENYVVMKFSPVFPYQKLQYFQH